MSVVNGNKCSWCKSRVDTLEMFTDAIGTVHTICPKCMETVAVKHLCRKCHEPISLDLSISGMCMECAQIDKVKKAKRVEEAASGVSSLDIADISPSEMTNEKFEHWMTLSPIFCADDIHKDKSNLLRTIWIKVKLMAAGLGNDILTPENVASFNEIIDTQLTKLLKRHCKVAIIHDDESKKQVQDYAMDGKVITSSGNVYIISSD